MYSPLPSLPFQVSPAPTTASTRPANKVSESGDGLGWGKRKKFALPLANLYSVSAHPFVWGTVSLRYIWLLLTSELTELSS